MPDLAGVVVAFGGGVLAAAIGANPAFMFTGFAVLIGVAIAASGAGDSFLTNVAFGNVFGPHVSFAGGAAALSYAWRRGYVKPEEVRDLGQSLMGLNRPDILLVGGAFGIGGYLFNLALQAVGWIPWTDTIAFTVFASGIAARLMFGKTGVFGASGPFHPDDNHCWLRWQETPLQLAAIGLGMGAVSSYAALLLGTSGGGTVLGFGLAASLLIFLQMGGKMPVTHHIALPAAIAALLTGNLIFGALIGVLSAFVGELFSRIFLIRGDTYVDPPAAAIATMTLVLRVADATNLLALLPGS